VIPLANWQAYHFSDVPHFLKKVKKFLFEEFSHTSKVFRSVHFPKSLPHFIQAPVPTTRLQRRGIFEEW
jgi:hypothetical protein